MTQAHARTGPVTSSAAVEDAGLFSRGKRVLGRIDAYQQSHRVPAVAVGVIKKFGDDRAGNLAALVSYYLFFSIFPLLLVFVTVVGFVLAADRELQKQLLDSALANFPVIGDQLRSNIGSASGSGVALAIGLVGALWGGMGAIGAMQNTMNTIWSIPLRDRPAMVQERVRSLIMLLVLAATIALSTALGAAAGAAGTWPFIGRAVVLIPSLAINVALFWVSFKVLTHQAPPWRSLLPGAAAAGLVFTVLQTVGAAYVNHVVQGAGPVYGTFAVVLGLLSWLFLQAQLTVLCAEINVVRERHLYPRSLLGSPLTTGDARALRAYALVEQRHPDETIEIHIDPPPDDSAPPLQAGSVGSAPSGSNIEVQEADDQKETMIPNDSALETDQRRVSTLVADSAPHEETTTAGLLGDVGSDLGELVSMHIDLAKTEIKEEIADAVKTAGVFAAGTFAAYMTIIFVSFTLAWVLTLWLPVWAGFAIITGAWAAGALALTLNGRTRSAHLAAVPHKTVETVKEDVQWAQHQNS